MTTLSEIREQRIREKAFELWKEAGCPEGESEVFWYSAIAKIAEEEAKLDNALKGTFPASDAPSSSSVASPSTDAKHPELPANCPKEQDF